MHPTTLSRRVLMRIFDPHVKPQLVEVSSTNQVDITWADGHKSSYASDWLIVRSFVAAEQETRRSFYARPIKLWGSEYQDQVLRVDFNQLLTDDKTLHSWLVAMEQTGLVLTTGAPCEPGQLERLGQRVAFLRPTHYGKTFNVKNKVNPNNLAYTSATLGLHSDLAYMSYVPGVQLLHCIQQTATEGGDNEFSDAFHVAEQLRRDQPEVFKVLTTTPVDFYDVGEEQSAKFYQYHRKPIISLNGEGEIVEVTYNNQVRDYTLNLPVDKVAPLYEALRIFDDALYAKENIVRLKLAEGDIISFANMRVLHGRLGFATQMERFLEGAYIDWDEIRSRRRVIDLDLFRDNYPFIA